MDNLGAEDNEDLNDVKDYLCQIKSGKVKGFGFFVEFIERFRPFDKCLITSISILDPTDIKNKKEIILDYKNSEKILKINDNRKIFSDNDLGYICIEIIEEDEIDDFIHTENNMFDSQKVSFINKKVYIPKYQKNTISFSSGKIISCAKNKLEHDCEIKEDSLGAPIFYKDEGFYAISLQKGYDTNNKNFITTPIIDIVKNIMHQINPFIFDEEYVFEHFDCLSDEVLKTLKNFNKINENSFLDIISKKFKDCSLKNLIPTFVEHLNLYDLNEDYKNELINYYTAKTKIIYDMNKDDDSIVNFMSKVYGKSNLACYYDFSFTIEFIQRDDSEDSEDEANGVKQTRLINSNNFAFLNGKFEFTNDNFDFAKNNIFIFGNHGRLNDEDYHFVSFRQQYSSLLTKIKDNAIYVLFHRDLKEIKYAIKIENNFKKNKILVAYDYGFYESLVEEFEKDEHFEKFDEKLDNLDNSKKIEIKFKDLIIYEIEN